MKKKVKSKKVKSELKAEASDLSEGKGKRKVENLISQFSFSQDSRRLLQCCCPLSPL